MLRVVQHPVPIARAEHMDEPLQEEGHDACVTNGSYHKSKVHTHEFAGLDDPCPCWETLEEGDQVRDVPPQDWDHDVVESFGASGEGGQSRARVG